MTVARLRQRVCDLAQRYDRRPSTALQTEAGKILGIITTLTGLANLHTAEAHAMLGDARACERSLHLAEERFARINRWDVAGHLYCTERSIQ